MVLEPDQGTRRGVLMIAYYFPPLGGAGVQRTVKFAKYLPDQGWRPTILTTRSNVYPVKDLTLARELPPDLSVVRAIEPRGAMAPAIALSRLGLERASRVAAFPDAAVGWIPDALRRAMKIVRSDRPAAIFSTSAPPSAHLLALAIQRRTGIPWVADFRDEWSANPHLRNDPALVLKAARRLERKIASRAAAMTVVEDYFEISNPAGSPVWVIPNGVDEEDFRGLHATKVRRQDRLTLSYVGSLYGEQDVTPVLAALERLGRRGAVDLNQICVRIVGSDLRGVEGSWPVPVEQIGYVPHRDALVEMLSATVLLHYVSPSSLAPAGKLYEYLASGRPVFCVARTDGRAADMVRAADAGLIAAPDDPAGIEQAILSFYHRWSNDGLPDQPHVRDWVMARYSRRKLTADLAAVLDQAASGGSKASSSSCSEVNA
ncbi:MAG: glycosyltransferase family 4 protein [Solirubrobacteraceae bacterium]